MIINTHDLDSQSTISSDLCVIGAGVSGIAFAKEWIGSSERIVLLESGGLEHDADTQSLYDAEAAHPFYTLKHGKTRYFGGSTNQWSGYCQPLQAIDFEKRDIHSRTGWPFSKEDLLPYYERALHVAGLDDLRLFDPEYVRGKINSDPFLFENSPVITETTQFANKRRFKQFYFEEFKAAENISLYLHANLTRFVTHPNGTSVNHAVVKTLDGKELFFKARYFILATGGIENPRILLASKQGDKNGLGDEHDGVGRCFMEHHYGTPGICLPNRIEDFDFYLKPHQLGKIGFNGYLSLSEDMMRKKRLLNFDVRFYHGHSILRSEGAKALYLVKKALQGQHKSDDLGKHLGQMMQDLGGLAKIAAWKMKHAVSGKPFDPDILMLDTVIEQSPHPENRVTLSDEKDLLGEPKAKLDFGLRDIDLNSFKESLQIFTGSLSAMNKGRFKVEIDPENAFEAFDDFGGHHMGTTRMHDDPKQGVVDPSGKIHTVDNLYVAGASLFPTSGAVNPTLTCLALAIRLADHLKHL